MKYSFSLTLATLMLSSQAYSTDMCLESYLKKGLVSGAAEASVECYENELKNKNLATDEKASIYNQLAYLNFFIAEETSEKAQRREIQDLAKKYSESSVELYGEPLNFDNYKELSSESRLVLSRSLYLDGLLLARISEEKGNLTVISNWSKIQKIMKMVMRLGHPSVEFYGAHRTLAIAHTRMPAVFGDRKMARQYFEMIITKTDSGNGLSKMIVNNLLYAELLFVLNEDEKACAQLQAVAAVTDQYINEFSPAHVHESTKNRKLAASEYQKNCARR